MRFNNRKFRLTPDDMRTAAIMVNYRKPDGSIDDVVSMAIDGMTPADAVSLSICGDENMYATLFAMPIEFYSPISMSTMLTRNHENIDWKEEDEKVNGFDSRMVSRVSLNIKYTGGVFTLDFPEPSENELKTLYGM